MKGALSLILGFLLVATALPAGAASPPAGSSWPSLGFNSAQSNDNTSEQTLNPSNVLKLHVRWTAAIAAASYPVVAGGIVYVPIMAHGKVHVRALNAATGSQTLVIPKDALGGLLAVSGHLYVAGHVLQDVDPQSGTALAQISARPTVPNGTFLDPVTDGKVLVAGYASTTANRSSTLYGIDPDNHTVLWRAPTASAQATVAAGQAVTVTRTGGTFENAMTGRVIAEKPAVFSRWFGGDGDFFTVATIAKRGSTLLASDQSGREVWRHTLGTAMLVQDWPHAVAGSAVYVGTFAPRTGVEALDPASGRVLWQRDIPAIERLALANGVLYALSYTLGAPVRLIALRADTGKVIGAIVLSSGYAAYDEPNDLMVADGMVFIRAVGPGGPALVALGLPH